MPNRGPLRGAQLSLEPELLRRPGIAFAGALEQRRHFGEFPLIEDDSVRCSSARW